MNPSDNYNLWSTLSDTSQGLQQFNALYQPLATAQYVPPSQGSFQYVGTDQPIPFIPNTAPASYTAPQQPIDLPTQQSHGYPALAAQQHQCHQLHPPSQPVPRQVPHIQPTPASPPSQSPTLPYTTDQNQNKKGPACDACNIRKVKCDRGGPPCKACEPLKLPCTFVRRQRRRGPQSRLAEIIKRSRLEEARHSRNLSEPPPSPINAAQALAALSSHKSNDYRLSAESICSLETLEVSIDDFFTYIYPLCPFPHEPSFREAWKHREDLSNNSFLALLASMIGALVSSFLQKPLLPLKAQRKEKLALIDRCQEVCSKARGPGYLEGDSLSVYDAATSYFLALSGTYTFRWRQAKLYFGECLTLLRTLGLYESKGHTYTRLGTFPISAGSYNGDYNAKHQNDNITSEMGRRIFWKMYMDTETLNRIHTASAGSVIPPPTTSNPYPPLPTEVDDVCIFRTSTEPQPNCDLPNSDLPLIAGFNANVRVFLSYSPLSTIEIASGINVSFHWERQERLLEKSLCQCKDLESPSKLTVRPLDGLEQYSGGSHCLLFAHSYTNKEPASSLVSPSTQMDNEQTPTPEQRRQMQREIQEANIRISNLLTRFYIVQQYWNLRKASQQTKPQDLRPNPNSSGTSVTATGSKGLAQQLNNSNAMEQEISQEEEEIVRHFLEVLGNIVRMNAKINANSIDNSVITKMVSIASMLRNTDSQRMDCALSEGLENMPDLKEAFGWLEQNHDSDETQH